MLYSLGVMAAILFFAYPPIPHFEWNTPEIYGSVVDVDGRPIKDAVVSIRGVKNIVQTSRTDDKGQYLVEPNKTFHMYIATQVKYPECHTNVDVAHPEYEALHVEFYAQGTSIICKDTKIEKNFTLSKRL